MTGVFDTLTLRSVTTRNRLWVAPMCQYSVLAEDGVPTDWHLVHLGGLARGGAGLVMAEATAVVPEGRITPRDTGIWNDEQTDAWRPIAAFIASQGAVPAIQLAHAGRKASTFAPWGFDRTGSVPFEEGGWETVSASPLAFGDFRAPRALDVTGIDRVIESFVQATLRSLEAGFQAVEVHAAHGYLLHQFLSPLSNHRDDEYGGALENRARLLLRIVRAVRPLLGDLPLLVRLSATDWVEGGWDVEQTATVASWLDGEGVDLVDVSSGGLAAEARVPTSPGYQVPFAERVGAATEAEVSAVGLITTPEQADEIVTAGRADVVMLGREVLRDPHFPLRAASALGVDVDYWPPQYARARPRS